MAGLGKPANKTSVSTITHVSFLLWSWFKFIIQTYLIFTCTFFLSSLDAQCFAQCLTQIRHEIYTYWMNEWVSECTNEWCQWAWKGQWIRRLIYLLLRSLLLLNIPRKETSSIASLVLVRRCFLWASDLWGWEAVFLKFRNILIASHI